MLPKVREFALLRNADNFTLINVLLPFDNGIDAAFHRSLFESLRPLFFSLMAALPAPSAVIATRRRFSPSLPFSLVMKTIHAAFSVTKNSGIGARFSLSDECAHEFTSSTFLLFFDNMTTTNNVPSESVL